MTSVVNTIWLVLQTTLGYSKQVGGFGFTPVEAEDDGVSSAGALMDV